MEANNALQILVNVANLAQSKGLFSFEDAEVVNNAIKFFKTKEADPALSVEDEAEVIEE